MFLYPFLYDVGKCNVRLPEVLDEQYAVLYQNYTALTNEVK